MPPHLVELELVMMGEVQGGQKEMDEFAAQAGAVDVLRQDLAEEVLAGAGPAVERERQRLLGAGVVAETHHRLQHHVLGQVLPKELGVQLRLQCCGQRESSAPHGHQRLLLTGRALGELGTATNGLWAPVTHRASSARPPTGTGLSTARPLPGTPGAAPVSDQLPAELRGRAGEPRAARCRVPPPQAPAVPVALRRCPALGQHST